MRKRVLHHASPICKHSNFQRAKDRHLMTHCTRPLLYAAAFLLLGPHAAGGADRFAGMDAYVAEAMQKWEVPGLAIAVVKDGKVVLARGYGVCEIATDRRVTTDTVFPIASCTKSFTAACIGILVEEGELRWDDRRQVRHCRRGPGRPDHRAAHQWSRFDRLGEGQRAPTGSAAHPDLSPFVCSHSIAWPF